jgi:hypothetical protein
MITNHYKKKIRYLSWDYLPYLMFQLLPNEGVKATGARKLLTSHENTNIAGLVALNVPGGAKTDVEPAVDMDLSLLSLVSVGPYEEFAVSISLNHHPSISCICCAVTNFSFDTSAWKISRFDFSVFNAIVILKI